ncbi:hypothetical protein OA93_06880 [Flavobacterium sp. KMS]|uniref:hypothetical protein n=1 Tax=Flavobacterium sp. KMS TaxID=1566023 RepID=UPI00058088E5|nr:hypothetical protein [Flavobacterium sp. KMS]KIA98941.1 hypothetical protein OA93_06880 [Flavobacterium sp. KMS]
MKNKLQRITQALLCCFVLIVLGCETEKLVIDEQTPQGKSILVVKTWFDQYESNGINYELFQNLEYNWTEAKITKSEDGTETIIVPVIKLKEDKEEIWSQKLYLYKLGAGNFKALLFEIYPDKNVPSGSQTIEEGNFNGYMAAWDLKMGFVRASRFKNNQVVENGIVAVISVDKNTTGKAPAILPCTDEGCQQGPGGLGDPVQLRNVNIPPKNTSTPPVGTPGSYFGPRTPVTGGTSPGGFTSPGGGGGSGGITAPTPVQIIDELTEKAKCLNALLNKNGNSFVQKLLSNFVGKSEFDIKIVSKDKVFSDETKTKELNGRTLPPINKTIIIEISIAKTNENSALDAARTILHEYIHADIFRKLNTTTGTNQEKLDFKTTYEAYGNQHNTIASMYLNSMRDALKEFHKNVLTDDYNKYINYYGEVPSDAFYEALAWGGLRDNNVKAWTDLSADKKAAIEKLASRVPLLSKLVPCP